MDSAAAELQRRRERGRLSQRAFRNRQAAELRGLREENSRLRAAIQRLVDAAAVSDHRTATAAGLRSVIRQAAEVVGLPASSCQPEPPLGGFDGSPIGNDDPTTVISGGGYISNTRNNNDMSIVSAAPPPPRLIPLPPGAANAFSWPDDYLLPVNQQPPGCTSIMTFRLDAGLFGPLLPPTSSIRIVDPPVDIEPYLGPERQRGLAGRIYWYCTEASLGLLYRLGGRQPSRADVIARHHPVFAATLRIVLRSCSPGYVVALAEARLQFRRLGYSRVDDPAAARDGSVLLRKHVEQQGGHYRHHQHDHSFLPSADGGVTRGNSEWLGPTGVARVTRETLRRREPALLGRLEAAVSTLGDSHDGGGSGGGAHDGFAQKALETFIHQLWLTSTCFGDEPRWRTSCVRTLAERLALQLCSCGR
ncbi:hypothetical protein B0H67DRAFT_211974 [Lasiosphaeris hirsuta]|uniref:BZIP domain-containing protein n=1 Tax=Lasiosphaeris hirsuta TaxID=260670 RepID=A0AA40AS80_9PEZI|nr:hypothetical protein B0H67DRAFT_211974 [Lasiosphaeris hirsuta]